MQRTTWIIGLLANILLKIQGSTKIEIISILSSFLFAKFKVAMWSNYYDKNHKIRLKEKLSVRSW